MFLYAYDTKSFNTVYSVHTYIVVSTEYNCNYKLRSVLKLKKMSVNLTENVMVIFC